MRKLLTALALVLFLTPVMAWGQSSLTYTQAAGTVTLGGTFQTAIPAGVNRKSCFIQNTSTRVLYVFFGTLGSATTANSFQIAASGGTFSCAQLGDFVNTLAINVTTTTTSDTFVVSYLQ